MTKQHFRSAKTPEGWVVFPFPPIKDKKWLIVCSDENMAKKVCELLTQNQVASPLLDKSYYIEIGLHKDGKTPLYQLKDEYLHS